MSRLLGGVPAVAAIALVAALAGCGERDGAAAGTPSPAVSATSATSRDSVAGVETAVREAEALLSSIDAELAADDAETG